MGARPGRMRQASRAAGQRRRQFTPRSGGSRARGGAQSRGGGGLSPPSPASRARTIAWLRSATSSLLRTFATWFRTVFGRDAEALPDLGVRAAGGDQLEDLELALRQLREGGSGA